MLAKVSTLLLAGCVVAAPVPNAALSQVYPNIPDDFIAQPPSKFASAQVYVPIPSDWIKMPESSPSQVYPGKRYSLAANSGSDQVYPPTIFFGGSKAPFEPVYHPYAKNDAAAKPASAQGYEWFTQNTVASSKSDPDQVNPATLYGLNPGLAQTYNHWNENPAVLSKPADRVLSKSAPVQVYPPRFYGGKVISGSDQVYTPSEWSKMANSGSAQVYGPNRDDPSVFDAQAYKSVPAQAYRPLELWTTRGPAQVYPPMMAKADDSGHQAQVYENPPEFSSDDAKQVYPPMRANPDESAAKRVYFDPGSEDEGNQAQVYTLPPLHVPDY